MRASEQHNILWVACFAIASVSWVGCGDESEELAQTRQPLEAVCVEDEAGIEEEDAWLCGESRTVECDTHDGAEVATIYVVDEAEAGAEGEEPPAACQGEYGVNDEGPFEPGTHTIIVNDEEGELCTSELVVVDTTPPEAEGLEVAIWPPNHKWHTITAEDCVEVEDACDEEVTVTFLAATSDEPSNSQGDGNTEPDIEMGCDEVRVRAERQGGGDGRVYTLSWRAEDDAGNSTEGTCTVSVPHDQSGRAAVDSGVAESYESEGCDDGEDDGSSDGESEDDGF